MGNPLCSNPRCRSPRHEPGCTDNECAPHPARLAADGLRLCLSHTEWLAENALEAARLYDELVLRLVGGVGTGDKVSGTPGTRLPDKRVIDARSDIYQTLTLIVGVITAGRGFSTPAPSPQAYARMVAANAEWLAAHHQAADFSVALGDLARGKTRSIAYPSGAKVVEVGPCPKPLHHGPEELPIGFIGPPRLVEVAGGTLRAIVRPGDALLPSEVICDVDAAHRWDSTQWRQLDRLVSTRRAA